MIKDTVKLVCNILEVDTGDVITFKDFIEKEFNKPYDELKDLPEIKMLRKTWNISCESLLNVLDGISMINKRIEEIRKKQS